MAGLLDFVPLVRETIARVRARLDSDANAGLGPTDPDFKDLTPGGIYWDVTQTLALEAERIWDLVGLEMPASMFPAFAWGTYLDEHAATVGLERKAAVRATGEILFVGEAGTLIPTGTQVSTEQTDPDAESIVFRTLEGIVLAALPAPTGLTGHATTMGTLVDDTYYYVVTALVDGEETIASGELSVVVDSSAATPTNAVWLQWNAVSGATRYYVYRGVASGVVRRLAEVLPVATPPESYVDNGSAAPSGDPPPTNIAAIEAVDVGTAGNVAAGTITLLLSPVGPIESLTNDNATSGGAEVETDFLLRIRVLAEYQAPRGGGTVADYERWALAHPPVGYAMVEPIWDGPGTVRVIITDQENNPLSATVVEDLLEILDPEPGHGRGLAPIGAIVTVATPVATTVAVTATVVVVDGYTLDTVGTITVRDDIEGAVTEYINGLRPGDDVVKGKIGAAILSVEGVYDVTVTLPAANVTITALQVAQAGTITLAV